MYGKSDATLEDITTLELAAMVSRHMGPTCPEPSPAPVPRAHQITGCFNWTH